MQDISIKNLSLTNKCNNDWECHLNAKMTWKEQGQYWHTYLYTILSSTVYNCFVAGTSAQIKGISRDIHISR